MGWFTKKQGQTDEKESLEQYLKRSNDFKQVYYINQPTNTQFSFSFIATL